MRDREFYEVYAALRHGIVMGRVNQRRVRFGEQEAPDEPDGLVNHAATLERMIDGELTCRGHRQLRASSVTGRGSAGCRLTGVITSICASELRRGPDQRAGTASIRYASA